MLFSLVLILVAFGFGATAIVTGRVQLTRRRTLRGRSARVAGVACIVIAIAFWWFSAEMWSRVTD